jgi:FKBP-type peptidyl-prolyl cis-trans isomerase
VKSTHYIAGLILAAAAIPALAQTTGNVPADKPVPAAKAATPAEIKAQASYSLGLSMGTQLHSLGVGVDAIAGDRLLAGFQAALSGKASESEEDQQRIQNFLESAHTALINTNTAAAAKFLADNGKKPGVVTTASGLQYKIIRAGSGSPPKASDTVTVDYEGKLLNGEVFDSSYKRGIPASFPVSGLIKGWTEALQLIQPGSKVELYIPPALAYGDEPPQGSGMPPASLLIFQLELKSIDKGDAAPATGGQKR